MLLNVFIEFAPAVEYTVCLPAPGDKVLVGSKMSKRAFDTQRKDGVVVSEFAKDGTPLIFVHVFEYTCITADRHVELDRQQ